LSADFLIFCWSTDNVSCYITARYRHGWRSRYTARGPNWICVSGVMSNSYLGACSWMSLYRCRQSSQSITSSSKMAIKEWR